MEDRKSLRILIAESDDYVGETLRTILGKFGHSVEWVRDGETALLRIAVNSPRFEVLLTGNRLDRVPGTELVAKARVSKFSGRIVVHASNLSDRDRRIYRECAVDYFLGKPAGLPELFASIGLTPPSTIEEGPVPGSLRSRENS